MPRRLRIAPGGLLYHVLNRAVGRSILFESPADYEAFERVIEFAHQRLAMRIVGYTLMPNHFHFALWPRKEGELSEFMRLLTVTHTNRWHVHHHTTGTGPLYQGRFKSFPIERDDHALTVLRYIDRNPLRAGKVKRAEQWQWGSLHHYASKNIPPGLMQPADLPVDRRRDWVSWVNTAQTAREVEAIQLCIKRGRPYGSDSWTRRTTSQLQLQSAFTQRGRPKKPQNA